MGKRSFRGGGLRLDYGAFLEALLRHDRIALICHHNADPDSLLSAYVLHRYLEGLGKKAEIFASLGVSALTKRLLESIAVGAIKIHGESALNSSFSCACLIDTSSLEQLSDELKRELSQRFKGEILIIDHHEPHPDTLKLVTEALIDPSAKATAVIIYRLLKHHKVSFSRDMAEALLAGIIYDTRRFINADYEVFCITAELLRLGAEYGRILSLISQKEIDLSERIARLKGAHRCRLYEVKVLNERILIAVSHVSSYEASVARALVDLGADLALVAGERKGMLRLCSRATRRFHELTGINLARDIMIPLGEMINGAGGGHALAASANGKGTYEEGLKQALILLENKLKMKLREIGD